MRDLLCDLIRATLCGSDLPTATEDEWQQCYDIALRQQVLAMVFPVVSGLSKERRPSFTLWAKWMAYAQNVANQQGQKRAVLQTLGTWLADEGLQTMVIKGFSLAVLYPRPELRECGDIDIYSTVDYDMVNDVLSRHNIAVSKPDGHHVHLTVDGVRVEHHFALHNSRVRHDKQGPIEALQRLAATGQMSTQIPGIVFPNAVFTALFTAWHAHKHFVAEKIELRHVVDWALALKRLTAEEDAAMREAMDNTRWRRFADTLTAIALHRLKLPEEWFTRQEVERAESIDFKLEQRVWDDIMVSPHTASGRTTMHRRLNIARRMMQNRWKYREFADVGAGEFLWKEFMGWLREY